MPGARQSGDASRCGCLYVVGTPIGNLQDLSRRAGDILGTVSLVAAEDTRRTRKLLSYLGLRIPLLSCHEHNEMEQQEKVLSFLNQGRDVALVSDAGTPGLSDPGARLVRKVMQSGCRVVPVPGPSAVATALSVAGMSADAFFFRGFLPSRKTERKKALEELSAMPYTMVFYEAPHRLKETLNDMLDILGDREVLLARELTKVHEEVVRSTISSLADELSARVQVKGEITLVVAGSQAVSREEQEVNQDVLVHALEVLSPCDTLSLRDKVDLLAGLTGVPRKKVYEFALEERKRHENS